jgi:hypothetical protein
MPDSTMARTRGSIRPAPSSLTVSARPSLTKRTAFRTASWSDTWYDPKGMSPTMSGRRTAEATARVMKSISSMVTGTVES